MKLPPPPPDYAKRMPAFKEGTGLIRAGQDTQGREVWLSPGAAGGWSSLAASARYQGLDLRIASAFRSLDHQEALVRRKLEAGRSLEDILTVNAYPGFSEHHTGNAIDFCTGAHPHLEKTFENTAEFEWLSSRAGAFGFHLSYPADNPYGIIYEPWHWCWRPLAETDRF